MVPSPRPVVNLTNEIGELHFIQSGNHLPLDVMVVGHAAAGIYYMSTSCRATQQPRRSSGILKVTFSSHPSNMWTMLKRSGMPIAKQVLFWGPGNRLHSVKVRSKSSIPYSHLWCPAAVLRGSALITPNQEHPYSLRGVNLRATNEAPFVNEWQERPLGSVAQCRELRCVLG